MGGETYSTITQDFTDTGPSPRGRGKRRPGGRRPRARGSIPAWAGKPAASCRCRPLTQVHPRVGGETDKWDWKPFRPMGPSPRGRGNPRCVRSSFSRHRSIPAWAGKPLVRVSIRHLVEVHPRVGGETQGIFPDDDTNRGPSPRGRGNRRRGQAGKAGQRSIPAWAGKPLSGRPCAACTGVHPRVGGETDVAIDYLSPDVGPSPRGRGNRPSFGDHVLTTGSIPAWAGKPAKRKGANREVQVHPRVGGETASTEPRHVGTAGPSPRGAGKPPHRTR